MDKVAARKFFKTAISHLETNHPQLLAKARRTGPETFKKLKAREFLMNYCWVVYASGFRYKVIKAHFPRLRKAYKNFDIEALARMRSLMPATRVFNNRRKAACFLTGAKAIQQEGFSAFKGRLRENGLDVLEELPGIGPVTKYHLAKNIGLVDLAKPDIWLERIAEVWRASSVQECVSYLATKSGETQHVVDIALWKAAEDGLLQWQDGDTRLSAPRKSRTRCRRGKAAASLRVKPCLR